MKKIFDILHKANTFSLDGFLPVILNGQPIGFVHKTKVLFLKNVHPWLVVTDKDILIDTPQKDYDTITQFFRSVNEQLVDQGVLKPSHQGEMLRILGQHSQRLGALNRYAFYFWGIRIFGVHLNGLVRKKDGIYMWYAKRAPGIGEAGKLDHLACGGQPALLRFDENMYKEASEEASIPATIMRQAMPVGMVACFFQQGQCLNKFTPIIYDLWLPENFVPINKDSSVSAFGLIPLRDLLQQPEKIMHFKTAAQVAIIHMLVRYGYIKPDDDDYLEIVTYLVKGFFPFNEMYY